MHAATAGFVRGTWYRSEDGTRGHRVILSDNAATARQAAERPWTRAPRMAVEHLG